MKTLHFLTPALVAVVLAGWLSTPGIARAQDSDESTVRQSIAAGAGFAEALLRRHPYLLSESEKDAVDQINRGLRVLESLSSVAPEPEGLAGPVREVLDRLSGLLAGRPSVAASEATPATVRQRGSGSGAAVSGEAAVIR